MPDLRDDLRTYFDELADRAQLERPEVPLPVPAPAAGGTRSGSRSPLALVAALVIVAVALVAVGVVVARRSKTAPLDVVAPTTKVPPPVASGGRWGLTVDPVTDLMDGQVVRVNAGGFAPGQMVAIVTCEASSTDPGRGVDDCDLETADQIPADGDGTVDHSYALRRIIRTQDAYDCGTEPRGCVVGIVPAASMVQAGTQLDSLRISFGPGPAATLPAIIMTPSSGLRDGTTVEIAGTGFRPDSDVWVAECPPATDCGYAAFGTPARVDAAGSFHQRLTLHRTFTVPATLANGVTDKTLDCTTDCTIIAVTMSVSGQLAASPLPFDLATP